MKPAEFSSLLRRVSAHIQSGGVSKNEAMRLIKRIADGISHDDEMLMKDVDKLMQKGLPRDPYSPSSSWIKSNYKLYNADIYYTMDRTVWIEDLNITVELPDTMNSMKKLEFYKGTNGASALIVFGDVDFYLKYLRSSANSDLTVSGGGSRAEDGSSPNANDVIEGFSDRFATVSSQGTLVTNAEFERRAKEYGYSYSPPSKL